MNILTSTSHSLSDAFKHYLCMRLKFRSSVLKDTPAGSKDDPRYQEYCPAKH